jgi:hypothetical protein
MFTTALRPQDLLDVAKRCVWFQPPEETLNDTPFFVAHVLTYGVHDDIVTMRKYVPDAQLIGALEEPPSGVFDERSWAYWNLILRDLSPPPPMPTRTFT